MIQKLCHHWPKLGNCRLTRTFRNVTHRHIGANLVKGNFFVKLNSNPVHTHILCVHVDVFPVTIGVDRFTTVVTIFFLFI